MLNNELDKEKKPRAVKLSSFHKQGRLRLLAKMLVLGGSEAAARMMWDTHRMERHDYGRRRPGRPRKDW
eukprot:12894812-Alexandrium_andersonii.AAC.1